jgi:hypothetical protein
MANRLSFEEFMKRVDAHIQLRAGGLGVDDIEDFDYRYAYIDGVSAKETALDALKNAGWHGLADPEWVG